MPQPRHEFRKNGDSTSRGSLGFYSTIWTDYREIKHITQRRAGSNAMGVTLCPACESTRITLGACAVGATTIHQEYICEACQHAFSGLFALVDFYDDFPRDDRTPPQGVR
ncbi:hypothetical protein [Cupriavidus necator]|uniref:hypothetical protein n=1 Tax=Cupriavidus necator TaxID=106590 RepID=UPI0012D2DBCC|nr:hypothetical protein [Cupriavidus necator]